MVTAAKQNETGKGKSGRQTNEQRSMLAGVQIIKKLIPNGI